jgi:hypothetical protein
MNPHNSLSHFEFTELNNLVLKNGGSVAAPRSKRNVPYTAPRDLPHNWFGGTSLHNGTATLDLPPHMFGKITSEEGLVLAGSAPIIIGTTAALFAVGGMFEAWSQEFFIGNKRSITYKQVAIRNGVLGAVFGAIGVASLGAAMARS